MWESIVSDVISGVIAGFVVAATLYLIRPRFELRQVSAGLAVLHHHGLFDVVLGGSYALERGRVLSTAEGFRAGTGGVLISRLSDKLFRVDKTSEGIVSVGEVVTISDRRAPLFLKYRPKLKLKTYGWEVDPIELYGPTKRKYRG